MSNAVVLFLLSNALENQAEKLLLSLAVAVTSWCFSSFHKS